MEIKHIHYAAKAGNISNVGFLAQFNLESLDGKNDLGETPLDLAPDRVALEQELASRKTEYVEDTENCKITNLTHSQENLPVANRLNNLVIQSGGIESFLGDLSTSFAELRS